MARKDSEQQLSTLIINKVDSEDTFQEMVDGELVNEDELYLVEGEGNDLGLSVVGGMLCASYEKPDSVTIYLTNPNNSSEFTSCDINEVFSNDFWDPGASYIDTIMSASGSKTVQVSSSAYGIIVIPNGMSVDIPNNGISTTGGVTFKQNESGQVLFEVNGDGTVTLDGIDYDD